MFKSAPMVNAAPKRPPKTRQPRPKNRPRGGQNKRQLRPAARAVATKFCPHGASVIIETSITKKDRYSRYIAEVFFKGANVSDYLLEKGVAVEVRY